MKRAIILADIQNIYYTTRQTFGCSFDYNAFWAQASQDYEIVHANAYAIDRGDEKQRQFQNILRAIGFEVKLKPFIQRADGSAKGDWDVGITLDAIQLAPQADCVILLTGDGDFDLLATALRERHGKRVEVYGVQHATARSLIHAADRYVPIEGPLLLSR